jgi:hypothetical protein
MLSSYLLLRAAALKHVMKVCRAHDAILRLASALDGVSGYLQKLDNFKGARYRTPKLF